MLYIKVDKRNGRIDTHKKYRDAIHQMVENNNFIDIWRLLNPFKL